MVICVILSIKNVSMQTLCKCSIHNIYYKYNNNIVTSVCLPSEYRSIVTRYVHSVYILCMFVYFC